MDTHSPTKMINCDHGIGYGTICYQLKILIQQMCHHNKSNYVAEMDLLNGRILHPEASTLSPIEVRNYLM